MKSNQYLPRRKRCDKFLAGLIFEDIVAVTISTKERRAKVLFSSAEQQLGTSNQVYTSKSVKKHT
jgi:hypothetical protein